MPRPLNFNTGSLIFANGDEAGKIYILQSGKISLVYEDIETGEDVRHQVQPGEFFGVKSALGNHPQQENAIAVTDSTVLEFSKTEFEAVAMSNVGVIIKMLKVMSNQMRRVHDQVCRILEAEEVKPDEGLFFIGEKYLQQQRYKQAKYVFSRYLELYPTGSKAAVASKNRQLAEISMELKTAGIKTPDGTGSAIKKGER